MSPYYENPEAYALSFANEVPHSDPVYTAIGMTVLSFNMLRLTIRDAVSRLAEFSEAATDISVLGTDFRAQVRVLSAAIWILESSKSFNTQGRSAPMCWHVLSTQCDRAFAKFEKIISLDSLTLRDMATSLKVAAPAVDRSQIVASKILDDVHYIHRLVRHLNEFFRGEAVDGCASRHIDG
jgi:hypothetical protein